MFTLLSPASLLGLALLAIPIIVHLLKPRKVRHTSFSSLRWLHLTQQRLSRRIRWHQVLLFLLRAAFIICLVLAIAKPIFNRGGGGGKSERIIVVDVSRSMGFRSGERPSPLQTAKQLAATLLAQETPGDRTALLATSKSTKVLGPLAHHGKGLTAALMSLQPSLVDTDLGSALEVIRPMLHQCRPGARVELFFLTDHQQGAWRENAIDALLTDFSEEQLNHLTTTVVDVSDAASKNAWIADCQLTEKGSGDRRSLDVHLRCSGGTQERHVRVLGVPGLESRRQAVSMEPARSTHVTFELPAGIDLRGKSAEIVLEPADGLPQDDRWFVALDAGASLRVLVVEGSVRSGAAHPPGFALKTALDSLSTPTQTIRVQGKKYNELTIDDLRDVDVIFLVDVPELSDASLRALEEQVKGGLGLAIFLGPSVNPEYYNAKLFNSLDKSGGLMPLRMDGVQNVPLALGGLAPWQGFDWNHPVLAGLLDPSLGDLALTQIRSYFRFATAGANTSGVLASVFDTPMLIEHHLGAGKIVVFNTTADDTWGDLSRRKSFVPLVDRLLAQLSGGKTGRSFQTGDALALPVPAAGANEAFSIIAPSGTVFTPTVHDVGTRAILRLPALQEPGVYEVRRGGDSSLETFVVQVGRGDSALAPFETDLLKKWWQPTELEVVSAESAVARWNGQHYPVSLSMGLIIFASGLLALEMFLVHWLCPRVNPAIAESVVQRRRPLVSHAGEVAKSSTS